MVGCSPPTTLSMSSGETDKNSVHKTGQTKHPVYWGFAALIQSSGSPKSNQFYQQSKQRIGHNVQPRSFPAMNIWTRNSDYWFIKPSIVSTLNGKCSWKPKSEMFPCLVTWEILTRDSRDRNNWIWYRVNWASSTCFVAPGICVNQLKQNWPL